MSDGGKSVEAGVKLLYFAWVRQRTGTGSETLALPPDVRDVRGLLDWLKTRSPGHADALKASDAVRVAVNQTYVQLDHPVRPGDEVAIFPPVTGGSQRTPLSSPSPRVSQSSPSPARNAGGGRRALAR